MGVSEAAGYFTMSTDRGFEGIVQTGGKGGTSAWHKRMEKGQEWTGRGYKCFVRGNSKGYECFARGNRKGV